MSVLWIFLVRLDFLLFLFIVSVGSMPIAEDRTQNSPVAGYWLTRKDDTNLPSSVIHLSVDEDGQMAGQVIVGFYETDAPLPSKICRKCSSKTADGRFGLNKKQAIVGSYSVWGFNKKSETSWVNGKVIRVKTGQLFSADLALREQNSLAVKVRYGIFSTTLLWERLTDSEVQSICSGNVSKITDYQDVKAFCVPDLKKK